MHHFAFWLLVCGNSLEENKAQNTFIRNKYLMIQGVVQYTANLCSINTAEIHKQKF